MEKSKWNLYAKTINKLYCDKCDKLYGKNTKTAKGGCVVCGAHLKKCVIKDK